MCSQLPYHGIRIVEYKAVLLSGRLASLSFADQGAEVIIVEGDAVPRLTDGDEAAEKACNAYLNRNKTKVVQKGSLAEQKQLLESADIVVVDGESADVFAEVQWQRAQRQIVLHICAALPGDTQFGHLKADCDEGLLLAMTGFFTDMAMCRFLSDRKAIYTPLKLCSVYAGVIGANAVAAALIDRHRNGNIGVEIHASRLAAGLSAIGALIAPQGIEGEPQHLHTELPGPTLRRGLTAEKLEEYKAACMKSPESQLWFEQRLMPLGSAYKTKDGTFILPMVTFNRRMARRLLDKLDLWETLSTTHGVVDADPYVKENDQHRYCNLGLPLNMSWDILVVIADALTKKFLEKDALSWEREMSSQGITCVQIQSFVDWMNDEQAKQLKISVEVDGCPGRQIGRSAWLTSVKNNGDYPALKKMQEVDSIADCPKIATQSGEAKPEAKRHDKPLEGYTVVDFTNVLAGPNCGRMLAELGATVYKVEPENPQHSPLVMVQWQTEGNAGKKTIILDFKTDKAKKIASDLVAKTDIVLFNKGEGQIERLGFDRATLDKMNKKIIKLNVQARRGESKEAESAQWPAYDPALQGKCGLSHRFGPDGCPTLHGIASCVDYLTGYAGAWAGLTALYQREVKGKESEEAGASLALTATLVQCTHIGDDHHTQRNVVPCGPYARGPSHHHKHVMLHKLGDDRWVYAYSEKDISEEVASYKTAAEAVAGLNQKGIPTTEVLTCAEAAKRFLDGGATKTVCCETKVRDGFTTRKWKPTWFCYEQQPLEHPGAVGPTGCDKDFIMKGVLKFSEADIKEAIDAGAVLGSFWSK